LELRLVLMDEFNSLLRDRAAALSAHVLRHEVDNLLRTRREGVDTVKDGIVLLISSVCTVRKLTVISLEFVAHTCTQLLVSSEACDLNIFSSALRVRARVRDMICARDASEGLSEVLAESAARGSVTDHVTRKASTMSSR
jgi:hypothetical protein